MDDDAYARPRAPLWWYFGESWGSPSNEVYERGATPLGSVCYHCGDPIAEGDRGLVQPFVDEHGGCWPVPRHIDCAICDVVQWRPCAKHKNDEGRA